MVLIRPNAKLKGYRTSADLVVAVNGVSNPKKFSIRLNQKKNAKNSSTRQVRR